MSIRVCIFLACLVLAGGAQIRFNNCGTDKTEYRPNSGYDYSLREVNGYLLERSSTSYFSSYASGQAQGLYQCRRDLSLDQCQKCVAIASVMADRSCPLMMTAIVWFDECWLRYSNNPLLSVVDYTFLVVALGYDSLADDRPAFLEFVRRMIDDSANEVKDGSRRNFVAKKVNTQNNFTQTRWLYSVVQCSEDLTPETCSLCIKNATTHLLLFSESRAGTCFLASCFFQFDIRSFINTSWVYNPPSYLSTSQALSPAPPSDSIFSSISRTPASSYNNTEIKTTQKWYETKLFIALVTVIGSVVGALLVGGLILKCCRDGCCHAGCCNSF